MRLATLNKEEIRMKKKYITPKYSEIVAQLDRFCAISTSVQIDLPNQDGISTDGNIKGGSISDNLDD